MALSIVQSTNYSSAAATSATGTLVFTAPPVAGNLLVVGMSYAFTKNPSAAPAGWYRIDSATDGSTAYLTTFYHIVAGSETNSYAFTTTGGDFLSVVGYEISGISLKPLDGFISNFNSGTSSITTSTVTPHFDSDQALAFVAQNDGASGGAYSGSTAAGWTINQNPYPNFHSMVGISKNALTTDAVTPINTSYTNVSSNNVATIILIRPNSANNFPGNEYRYGIVGNGMSRSEAWS